MSDARAPRLAEMTTLRIGGRPRAYRALDDERDLIDAVQQTDADGERLLLIGGGSNLLVGDEDYPGTVIRDERSGIRVDHDSTCGGILVTATAGTSWDMLVNYSVEQQWSGLEALSGIPGSVGAAPVQNIGAYGRELAQNLSHIRAYDRHTRQVRSLPRDFLKLGYRDSLLKQSLGREPGEGQPAWQDTGRWIVLEVTLQLQPGRMSAPVRYRELAENLGVKVGERAAASDVRSAVLQLRKSKGMVLDSSDHDTWSAGSFFTNPILDEDQAERLLPDEAPRFPIENRSLVGLATPNKAAPIDPGRVKTSAAWLIHHSGFDRGWSLFPGAPAALSSKHVLAVTNRGGATAADVVDLAKAVHDGVVNQFGISLVPEPVFVGATLGND